MNTQKLANFEIQETILVQLKASKVNGFPFFAYTGIRNFVMMGETELKLSVPKNPSGLKSVLVVYDYGTDTYTVIPQLDANFPVKRVEEVYCDMLAETIAREMGVL